MANKLFLLILLALCIYFYQKKATDGLILTGIFILYLAFFNSSSHSEHMGALSESIDEKIQDIANMYNDGTLTATNLNLTGNLTVGGTSTLNGNITNTNGTNTVANNLTVTGTTNLGTAKIGATTMDSIWNLGTFHSGSGTGSVNFDNNGNIEAGDVKVDGRLRLPTPGNSILFGPVNGTVGLGLSSDSSNFAAYTIPDSSQNPFAYYFASNTFNTSANYSGSSNFAKTNYTS